MVGRVLSFSDGKLPGAMLNFMGVRSERLGGKLDFPQPQKGPLARRDVDGLLGRRAGGTGMKKHPVPLPRKPTAKGP